MSKGKLNMINWPALEWFPPEGLESLIHHLPWRFTGYKLNRDTVTQRFCLVNERLIPQMARTPVISSEGGWTPKTFARSVLTSYFIGDTALYFSST